MRAELSERDMADLAALADGSLAPERRREVEARVAASPELRELLERQRRALAATAMLADEPAPGRLAAAVTTAVQRRRPQRRRPGRRLTLAFSAAGAAAVLIIVALLTFGGPATPSLADAARLAALPPTGPPPAALDARHTTLAASVQGVGFPDYSTTFGWRASGRRDGSLQGRAAVVVYYESKGARIAYVIVAGKALSRPAAAVHTVDGVAYQSLSLRGRPAVTWQQGGHTCLLTGAAPSAELLDLAAWSSAYAGRS